MRREGRLHRDARLAGADGASLPGRVQERRRQLERRYGGRVYIVFIVWHLIAIATGVADAVTRASVASA